MLYLLEITKEAYVLRDTKSTKHSSPLTIKTRSTYVSYAFIEYIKQKSKVVKLAKKDKYPANVLYKNKGQS